jgi:hypothetical protein
MGNVIGDNAMHGLFMQNGASVADYDIIANNDFVRNCRLAACSSLPSNVMFSRSDSVLVGNESWQPGQCPSYDTTCASGGSTNPADGFLIKGSRNVLVGNYSSDAPTSYSGIHLVAGANENIVGMNGFNNNAKDITVDSGASDNKLYGPGLVSDAGTRTTMNNIALTGNAGDPETAGVWNGQPKWPGLQILDTVNNILWVYLTNGGTGITNRVQVQYGQTMPSPYLYWPGVIPNSQIMLRLQMPFTWTVPVGLASTQCSSGVAATGTTVLTLAKNGTSFGTCTFVALGTVGSLVSAAGASFAAGDILTITNQATADATLANVSVTVLGTH